MKSDRIINIVFVGTKKNDTEKQEPEVWIFTLDGGSKKVSWEEGLDACEAIIKERNIPDLVSFRAMLNKDIIYMVDKDVFDKNKYISPNSLRRDLIAEAILSELGYEVEESKEAEEEQPLFVDHNEDKEDKEEYDEGCEDEYEGEDDYDLLDDGLADTVKNEAVQPLPVVTKKEEQEEKEEKGILGFFKKKVRQIMKSKLVSRIATGVVTFALAVSGLGLYSCAARKTTKGQMHNSNLASLTRILDLDDLFGIKDEVSASVASTKAMKKASTDVAEATTSGENQSVSIANAKTYEQLLAVTNNDAQRRAMRNVYDTLYKFNGEFANAYVEEGKDVKPALSFDEVVALQQAYNDYSKEDIMAIFNGAEVNASDMSRAYKDASLQLMGAYVIETSANPVDMSILIESEEGKEFYNRYHQMFLAAKEATGEEKLRLINEFFRAVKNDFPITDEVRTEGIAHSDAYHSVMEGKGGAGPAVAPMIAAAEAMWQNYDIDYTLNDAEIDFLNDIGLCKLVDEKFVRIEVITLGTCKEDGTNPTYHQYKAVIIHTLEGMKLYVIDDAHRELTKLDAFKRHFKYDGDWKYEGGFYETKETYNIETNTNTWTETETTYRKEETRVEKPIPESEKEKIDAEIKEENEKAKEEGEKKAEDRRKQMQEEEDKKKDAIDKEVEEDAEDLHDKIDDANDPSNDKPVNEDDLGHGAEFDSEDSDEDGNLKDAEHITTDPTDDQTNEELPNPEVTGAEFDAEAEDLIEKVVYDEPVTDFEDVTPEPEATYEEPEPVQESTPIVEYEEVVLDDGSGYYEEVVDDYEEVVDDYVETLADSEAVEEEYVETLADSEEVEEGYAYQK